MVYFNTYGVKSTGITEILKYLKKREITHVFHDIDGTHSLIREWQPVMSRVLYSVTENGLPDGYDSDENIKSLIELCGVCKLEETDEFCVESAGLSALTQMEWAIRRGIENRKITALNDILSEEDMRINSTIVKRIFMGEELFEDVKENEAVKEFLSIHTPRLFKTYEKVLNGYCRDKNLAAAKENPDKFLIKGSKEFMDFLYRNGAKNYFVTGAVVDTTAPEPMGMYEEVLALGFEIGEGKTVEAICGSTWTEKIPKEEVMKRLCRELEINPGNVLVVGDGRSEIYAGREMGAIIMGRLPKDAGRQRTLHSELGAHVIVEDFSDIELILSAD